MFYQTTKIPNQSPVTDDLVLSMLIKFQHVSILVLYGHPASVFRCYLSFLYKKIMPEITFLFPHKGLNPDDEWYDYYFNVSD